MINKHVLIVDDEEGQRDLLSRFTQAADLDLIVTTAKSLKQALSFSAQQDYSLVILDGLYGKCFEVAETIKQKQPKTKVFLCSTDPQITGQLPHPRFDGKLDKPLDLLEYHKFLNDLYSPNSPQDN